MAADWQAVDDYIAGKLLGDDDVLAAALSHNAAQGLPPIDVSAAQGKMLFLLAQTAGAKRILEVGTLGGYSTIWLARALPEGGALVTLELEAHHAAVARANLERAGVADKVDIRVGPAADSLAAMATGAPFDFVFIDADKQNNALYVDEAIRLNPREPRRPALPCRGARRRPSRNGARCRRAARGSRRRRPRCTRGSPRSRTHRTSGCGRRT